MTRLLLIVAVIAVVFWLLKSYRKQTSRDESQVAEDMVRCAQCGVHLPKGESVSADGRYFCCAAHRDEFARRPN